MIEDITPKTRMNDTLKASVPYKDLHDLYKCIYTVLYCWRVCYKWEYGLVDWGLARGFAWLGYLALSWPRSFVLKKDKKSKSSSFLPKYSIKLLLLQQITTTFSKCNVWRTLSVNLEPLGYFLVVFSSKFCWRSSRLLVFGSLICWIKTSVDIHKKYSDILEYCSSWISKLR